MKMIDVLIKLANDEIKDQTILEIHDPAHTLYTYTFNGKYKSFYSNTKYSRELSNYFKINDNFLNYEVELIPPKEKKYLVKLNIRGWKEHFRYLNYYEKNESIEINSKRCTDFAKTHFTKDELQSIQPVREFLEDMEGKYELIEVEENEID
ncbi:hypothetical protein MMJ61_08125 [Enterococcus cecorum]|uniref:hypothetical protein n=1 Tax=Enterococcus cecorum TaxID=44008 RepID=UPI001FABECBB|nr:hypothetical protein [Enterococcus cecorum]MCJ0572156.1 hypothetical protein [Enterococcus cecorum]